MGNAVNARHTNRRVLLLTGGVGGAKLALGLYRRLAANELVAVVNTGDDFDHLGLRICPDIDTTLYTLAGLADTGRGWGRANESWNCLDTLAELGGEDWFRLGDRDLALHLLRTQALRKGATLSQVTADVARGMCIAADIVPMSNQQVATELRTNEGQLAFQDYFVRRQCEPAVEAIRFRGAEHAEPDPGVVSLMKSSELRAVIIAPSNPWLSIDPILAVPGMRTLLQNTDAPVIAVSPIIGGSAVKGPTAKIMRELGLQPSTISVLEHYRDFLSGYIFDREDSQLRAEIPIPCVCTQTLMQSLEDREKLAETVLHFADSLGANNPETISQ